MGVALLDEACASASDFRVPRSRVAELALAALSRLEQPPPAAATAAVRGQHLCQRGRALLLLERWAEAEEALTRAVKLDASVACWLSLGECLWRRGELAGAGACFTCGREADEKDARPLVQLSSLARTLAQSARDACVHTEESVELARRALALDVGSGEAWRCSALAHMAHGLALRGRESEESARQLQAALRAFEQAGKLGEAARDPDACYNHGVLLRFLEDWEGAHACFLAAGALDPTLPWQREASALRALCADTSALVAAGGRSPADLPADLQTHSPADLQTSLAAAVAALRPPGDLPTATLDSLALGANAGVQLPCALLALVTGPNASPAVCVAVDGAGSVFAFASQHAFPVREGALATLLHPFLRRVRREPGSAEEDGSFALVALDSPAHLCLQREGTGKWEAPTNGNAALVLRSERT